MLDRNLIRTEPELVRERVARKGIQAPIDDFQRVDSAWRAALLEREQVSSEQNLISRKIPELMKAGDGAGAEEAKSKSKELKEKLIHLEATERELEAELQRIELEFANLPHESVPVGGSEDENVVVRTWGEPVKLATPAKPHWEIASELGLVDFERATKISGSGFACYTGWGARLQRALFQFMIDHQTQRNGYRDIYPPYLVLGSSLVGTGQLPKFEEDLYKVDDDLYLIPTAEVPVTNLYRDEILDIGELPVKMAAFSGCFRKEAGSAGKDTRGLLRVHQFDKVELVKIVAPETSYDELESLVTDAESVLQALGLHYRVTLLCTGEMSYSNAKCYDLELWAPGVGRYLEISSCSNFEAFQARRAGIRFRREKGAKPEFCHILNGSGLATPRLFAAILEVGQQPDGSVILPEPLRPYVGTDRLTKS